MKYQGSCHCGRTTYEVECEPGPALECNCSHCSRKGLLLWFVPRGNLTLITPDSQLATYTFNKHHIRHRFCPACGCAPFGEATDRAGRPTAAINVHCLVGVDLDALERTPYDGRSL